jgi:uncharacterized protein YjdB
VLKFIFRGIVMMRRKFVLLIFMLLLGFELFPKFSPVYALDTLKPDLDSSAIDESSKNTTTVNEKAAAASENTQSTFSTQAAVENPSVVYAAHVQDIGWQNAVADGQRSGTEGQAKRLESIKISVKNVQDLGVTYSTHVQDYGWLGYVSDGAESGTTGKAKRIEAIKIKLTGSKAENYDIYYRVHAEYYGWMNWVKNGEMAGTTGEAKRLEAIEIIIVKKELPPPSSTEPSVTYRTYLQGDQWLGAVSDGQTSGELNSAKLLEAIQISLNNAPYPGGISYNTHIQDYGWLDPVSDGKTSGKPGENKQVEAIQINLTGDMAQHYDVYYRVHSQSFGWLGWAKNGQAAGTEGMAKPLQAIEIVLVKKNQGAPGATDRPFLTKPSVVYSTHVQEYGWLASVTDGEMGGTTGQGKRLEAIKIDLQNPYLKGDIVYSTHVQDIGWLNNVSNGNISGTTGQGKQVEAIKINLTGEIANYYDVYYRVHSETFGWLDWAKNGEPAGTEGLAKHVEAIEIVLVEKGKNAPGSTDKTFVTKPSVVYSTHVESYGWLSTVANGAMSGTSGQAKRLEAIKINLQNTSFTGDIVYSTHVQDYGWMPSVSNGEISGTTGQGKRLEAININLTGEIANYFDVYYRVHIESYGWLGWAKNGMNAGSQGLSKRLEAIEIRLVPKGEDGPQVIAKEAYKQRLTVFLDPGHGGSDPGATVGGYHEADLNLAVAKKVQSLLLARGYNVYMSRYNDTYISLLDRPQMANNLSADIFISIHTNSTTGEETSANGIESYYYEYDPNYPPKINVNMHNNPERILKSIALTNLIHENLIQYTGANNRGTSGETFAVIRESAMPATLIEIGFINNSSERQKLFSDSYQNLLAKAIADGIEEYFAIY